MAKREIVVKDMSEDYIPVKMKEKQMEVASAVGNVMQWSGIRLVQSDRDVADRLIEYFARCEENGELPTVEKMATALGTYTARLKKWENGESLMPGMTEATTEMIRKAKHNIAAVDAELVALGRMNVVSYIYRSKNFYGMKDQVESIITKTDVNRSTEELMKRYADVIDVEVVDDSKAEPIEAEIVEEEKTAY